MALKKIKQPKRRDYIAAHSTFPVDSHAGMKRITRIYLSDGKRGFGSVSAYRHFRYMLRDACLNANYDFAEPRREGRQAVEKALSDASKALERARARIADLGHDARTHLRHAAGRSIRPDREKLEAWCTPAPPNFEMGAEFYVERAQAATDQLQEWLNSARDNAKPQSGAGRPEDIKVVHLVARLAQLWEAASGEPPPIPHWSGYEERIVGDFADLCEAITEEIWKKHGEPRPSIGHYARNEARRAHGPMKEAIEALTALEGRSKGGNSPKKK